MKLDIVSQGQSLAETDMVRLNYRITAGLGNVGAPISSIRVTVSTPPDGTGVSIGLQVRQSNKTTTVVRRVGQRLFDTLDQAISRAQVCVTRKSDRASVWRVGSREPPQRLDGQRLYQQ